MKLGLIYYKNLLDASIEKMFASIGNMFIRLDDGKYVFAAGWNEVKIMQLFTQCLKDSMLNIVSPSTQTYDKYIVIGSCWPKDNLLLKFKDSSYFPHKLEKLINDKPTIKYMLREKDICIDIESMNKMFVDVFNKAFNDMNYVKKLLGKDFSNVIFLSHSHLDCYALFKTIKWAYGNTNCINIWKEKMHKQLQHLVAINELIAKYIQKKTYMNSSIEIKMYAKEVKDYLNEKIAI